MSDTRHILLLAAAMLMAVLSGCAGEKGPQPSNLVIISLDTLRADHLGLYGYSRAASPILDALGDDSVVFQRAVSQSASTTPAHRALFQSRPASAFKERGPMLAQVLSDHGYATAAWTGGGNVAAQLGFGKGFDRYLEERTGLAGSAEAVRQWLEQQGNGPFFLFLHTYDIHLPYDPPPPHNRRFFPGYRGSLSGAASLDLLWQVRKMGPYQDLEVPPDVTDEDRRRIVALYDGGIHHTDLQVGRFLADLRQLGLDRNTHVVLLSDHGEEFWDHGSVIHSHTVYEELIHVPLIWRLPDNRHAGQQVDRLVRLMDVAPTALELLGLTSPPGFRGRSLVPLMEGEADPPRASISEMQRLRAWTTDDWKLVIDWSSRTEQLFHMKDDPGEQHDLYGDYPDIAAGLREEMVRSKGGRNREEVPEMDPGIIDGDLRERLLELGYVE